MGLFHATISTSSRAGLWLPLGFVAIVLFGALLRIARLHAIPPGLFFDEAANLFDIVDVLNGHRPLYFPRNNGREPFFFYWASLFASIWGPTPYAIRLASALLGVLTIVTTFLCAREMFRAWSRDRRWADGMALASAFVLAITYTHLHYSRIGLRSISLPLFLALSYGLAFRGLRRNSWWALSASGIAGGLSLYTYISSRIAPLPLLTLPFALGFPRRSWRPFWQIAFVGVIWATVCVPFGVYTLRHPQDVLGHTDDVSILNAANNHGDPRGAVVHGVLATLAAFTFVGTEAADQNLPGRPILDPLLSLFFLLGLGTLIVEAMRTGASQDGTSEARSSETGSVDVADLNSRERLTRPRRGGAGETISPKETDSTSVERPHRGPLPEEEGRRSAAGLSDGRSKTVLPPGDPMGAGMNRNWRPAVASFLVVWILSQSLPSILAVSPPGFIRLTGTLPAVAIVVGFGLGFSYRWLARRGMRASSTVAMLIAALAVSTGWTVRDYFWIWGPSATAYHWMMGDKVDSANYLDLWARQDRVFLAPLYAQDNTIRFLTRGSPIESFDLGASLVVPTDRTKAVRYVFPSSDRAEISRVAQELPVQPTIHAVRDPSGRFTLLTVLEIPPQELPPPPRARLATFDGGIGLVSASIAPNSLAPGQQLEIILEWLNLQPQPYDYTVFVHLRDAANHTVAQIDRQPTAGSFPTTSWRTGDLIWDRYTLAVPSSVRPGEYHLVVGLYRLATMQRLMAQPGSGQPPTNEVTVGMVKVSGD
jgi:hypothetical protein